MPNEKNHLYTPDDEKRDRKNANKRKEQQQFSRFSTALATSVNNANLIATSPALQRETKPQIGDPYDDSKGSVSTNQVIDLSVFGANYSFFTVTSDVAFTFENLPTGRHMMFVVDILVDTPGGAVITFPQVVNPPVLAGSNGDRYVLEFVGVVRSDPEGINPPVETYTFISGPFNPGGITNPVGATGGHIVKVIDDSIINSTSLQPDSELSFSILPNKVYFLELDTNFISATNADMKFGLLIPPGASYKLASSNFQGSNWLPFTTTSNGNTITFDGALSLSRQSNHYYIVEAGPVGGTVSITFAQGTPQNTITKLERGTLLRIFEGGRGGLPPEGPDTFGLGHLSVCDYRSYTSTAVAQVGWNANASNGGDATTRVPIPRPGRFVRIICDVTVNGAGERTDIFTNVNGALILIGNIPAGATGFFTFLADQTFLREDRISVTIDRIDGIFTVEMHLTMELALDESGERTIIGGTSRIFGQAPQFANIVSPPYQTSPGPGQRTTEGIWTTSFERGGIIKDMWHFGTAPAGTGLFELVPRVNGFDAIVPKIVPAHAGVVLTKFDNINVPFNAGDLINWRIKPALGTNAEFVIIGRIILI